jgi:hypothetical protein
MISMRKSGFNERNSIMEPINDLGFPALLMTQRLACRSRSVSPANFGWFRIAVGRISSKVRKNHDLESVSINKTAARLVAGLSTAGSARTPTPLGTR